MAPDSPRHPEVPGAARPGALHRAVERLAVLAAVLGGLVLTALVALTCLSILGRSGNSLLHSDAVEAVAPGLAARLLDLGVGPIDGDFELVEAGVALAIFAFLPICQLRAGHATVDVFTRMLPRGAERAIVAFWELVLAAAIVLIAWRLHAGLEDKMRNGQTTFILQFPVWWAYAASLAGAAVAAVVAVHCALARLVSAFTGRDPLARDDAPR